MTKEIVFVGRMQNKTRDYIHNLEREVKLLQQENKELQNKIDKAIEYMNNNKIDNYEVDGSPLFCGMFSDLLEILKDSDVDE